MNKKMKRNKPLVFYVYSFPKTDSNYSLDFTKDKMIFSFIISDKPELVFFFIFYIVTFVIFPHTD